LKTASTKNSTVPPRPIGVWPMWISSVAPVPKACTPRIWPSRAAGASEVDAVERGRVHDEVEVDGCGDPG
jgi:hypothetical protein